MVVDVVVQNPQKSNEHEYAEKHVRRDSKMCCCCRFCCGAPTTDERIHASVLHDASQIAYFRYCGRASLPPITSTGLTVCGHNKMYLVIFVFLICIIVSRRRGYYITLVYVTCFFLNKNRVFAKVRFSKCTSLKIVPKAAFAVHF